MWKRTSFCLSQSLIYLYPCFCHVSTSDLSLSVGATSRHCNPDLGKSQCVRWLSWSSSRAGVLMHPFSESSALGVLCLPHVPCMQITLWDMTLSWAVSVPVALQRWCILPRPYTLCMDPSRVGLLPSGTGGVAWKPPFFIYYYCLGYRGPRPLRPYRAVSYCVASSTVTPTCGYQEGTPFWHRHIPGAKPGRHSRAVNARGR